MKRATPFLLVAIIVIISLASCQKPTDLLQPQLAVVEVIKPTVQDTNLTCGTALNTPFAKKIDSIEYVYNEVYGLRRKTSSVVSLLSIKYVYIDFNGQTVQNTPWNNGGPAIICPSVMNQLTTAQRNEIVAGVREHYSRWNVIVTTDQNEYNNAPPDARTRVIVTRNMNSVFPPAAGYALTGSMFWGIEAPCFVMADNLGYSVYNIVWNISHETGHTIGLNHQSLWQNGQLISPYHPIVGVNQWDAYGKIMGTCYSSNFTGWSDGTDEFGNFQSDVGLFDSVLGAKIDDAPNEMSNSLPFVTFGTTYKMVLETNGADVLRVNKKSCKITLTGFNTDMQVVVYDQNGYYITTLDAPTGVGVSTTTVTASVGNKLFLVIKRSANNTNIGSSGGSYDITIKQ